MCTRVTYLIHNGRILTVLPNNQANEANEATARRELSDAAALTVRQSAHCYHWSAFGHLGIA